MRKDAPAVMLRLLKNRNFLLFSFNIRHNDRETGRIFDSTSGTSFARVSYGLGYFEYFYSRVYRY